MTKKILIITDDFIHNSEKSCAVLIKDLSHAINESDNFSSIVVAPNPNSNEIEKLYIDNIFTILFPSGNTKNTNYILRTYHEYRFSSRIKKCFHLIKSDDIFGIVYYSPSIFFGNAVNYLKKKLDCHSYLILRDLFPQWVVDIGLIKKNSIPHLIFKYFEKINYDAADKIGVMSKSNLGLFSSRNDYYKFEILSNWQKAIHISKKPELLQKFNLLELKDKFVFFLWR